MNPADSQHGDGHLAQEGCDHGEGGSMINVLRQIASKENTPFYAYDRASLNNSFSRLASLWGNARMLYSMKANPNPHIVRQFAELGCGVEVASCGELEIALSCGLSADSITFAGPGKTDVELQLAIQAGLLAINAESVGEIERIDRISRSNDIITSTALRINPGKGVASAGLAMGGKATQFGVAQEQAADVLQWAATLKNVRCIGIHVYAGTQILDSEQLRDYLGRTIRMGAELSQQFGLSMISLGGGFGVPYHEGETPLDMDVVAEAFGELESTACRQDRLDIYIESGRYMVAESGYYVARIVDIKKCRGKTFVVLDGGINHCATSAGIGRILRRNRRSSVITSEEPSGTYPADIVGPLCTSADCIGEKIEIPDCTKLGDLVVLHDAGAYGRSMSPLCFLSHNWPAEFLVDTDGDYRQIAADISAMDLVRLQGGQ